MGLRKKSLLHNTIVTIYSRVVHQPSTADERRQYSIIVYDDLLWNALVVERASKQYDHARTFHRSTSSVGLAGAHGEFPVIRAATELMHDLRRKSN